VDLSNCSTYLINKPITVYNIEQYNNVPNSIQLNIDNSVTNIARRKQKTAVYCFIGYNSQALSGCRVRYYHGHM